MLASRLRVRRASPHDTRFAAPSQLAMQSPPRDDDGSEPVPPYYEEWLILWSMVLDYKEGSEEIELVDDRMAKGRCGDGWYASVGNTYYERYQWMKRWESMWSPAEFSAFSSPQRRVPNAWYRNPGPHAEGDIQEAAHVRWMMEMMMDTMPQAVKTWFSNFDWKDDAKDEFFCMTALRRLRIFNILINDDARRLNVGQLYGRTNTMLFELGIAVQKAVDYFPMPCEAETCEMRWLEESL